MPKASVMPESGRWLVEPGQQEDPCRQISFSPVAYHGAIKNVTASGFTNTFGGPMACELDGFDYVCDTDAFAYDGGSFGLYDAMFQVESHWEGSFSSATELTGDYLVDYLSCDGADCGSVMGEIPCHAAFGYSATFDG